WTRRRSIPELFSRGPDLDPRHGGLGDRWTRPRVVPLSETRDERLDRAGHRAQGTFRSAPIFFRFSTTFGSSGIPSLRYCSMRASPYPLWPPSSSPSPPRGRRPPPRRFARAFSTRFGSVELLPVSSTAHPWGIGFASRL